MASIFLCGRALHDFIISLLSTVFEMVARDLAREDDGERERGKREREGKIERESETERKRATATMQLINS